MERRDKYFGVKFFEIYTYEGVLRSLWKICMMKKMHIDFSIFAAK